MLKNKMYLFIIPAIALLVGSCTTQQRGKTVSEEVFEILQQEKEEEEKNSTKVPDFVSQALQQDKDFKHQPPDFLKSRFDVSVEKIPAKTFFLSLISDVGVNVVAHPKVSGEISLELKSVTVEEVLNVVRDVYGYEYQFRNNIYTVYPVELRTKIFPINYIDVKRVGVSDTNVSIGDISSSSGSGGQSGGEGGSEQAVDILGMVGVDGMRGGSITPGSRVQTITGTDFWAMLKQTTSSIVDVSKEGRRVVVNPQSGLIIVTAMPSELNVVREFLEKAELSVQRQVILETQILEVRLSEGFEAGVDWASIQGQLNYEKSIAVNKTYSNPASILKTGAESFSSIFNVVDIRELLSLLKTQGAVQVLSSPRVSTVNNQKAVIRVGTDEFFVTGLSNSTTSSGGTTTTSTSPEVELTSFFSGISLDVTPQISENGDVILHVHPIISEVKDQVKELSVGEQRISLPLAVRDVRESDSIVRVSNGQVIVLGGLMQKSSNDLDRRQPWLSKVPVLNALFKYKKESSVKTELVILMRPIVVEDDTWDKQIYNLRKKSDIMAEEFRNQ